MSTAVLEAPKLDTPKAQTIVQATPQTTEAFLPTPDLPFANRKKWNADECDQLERYGFLPQRYELLNGEIINKMGQHLPHAFGVSGITFYLYGFLTRNEVISQTTVIVAPEDAPNNRPQPDVAVLASATRKPGLAIPTAADLRIVMEVSDSTLADDLGYKADLYARAGVPEYWVLDINGRRLIVHTLPVNGKYTVVTPHDEYSRAAPLFAPNQSVLVGDLL